MRKKALHKDFIMEIKKSFPRFLSILLIVALGVAFFSGVRASKPDMTLSADQYYDNSNLMDIQVLSTLGLTEEDVEALGEIEGVHEIMPSYSIDVLSGTGDGNIVIKLMSAPTEINIINVSEGRMPANPKECLVDEAYVDITKCKIGDTITVASGTDSLLEDSITEDTFIITGIGSSSYYMAHDRGTSNIGNGTVEGFVIVPEDTFCLEIYTEIYITITDGLVLTSYTKEYTNRVDEVVDKIEDITDERAQIRYENLYTEGQELIADAEKELKEGEQKLLDAKEELESGRQELVDAKETLKEKEQELIDGEAEIASAKSEFEDGKAQLADAYNELFASKEEISSGWQAVNEARTQLEEAAAALQTGKTELDQSKVEYEAGITKLEENKQILLQLQAAYKLGDISYEEQISLLEAGIIEGEETLAAAKVQIDTAEAEIAVSEAQITAGLQEIAQTEAALVDAGNQITEAEQTLYSKQAEADAAQIEIEEAEITIQDGKVKIEEAKTELAEAEQKLADGEKEYEEAVKENQPKIDTAKIDIEEGKQELEDLEVPNWYVLTREHNQTYVEYGQNADRIGAIGTVFPLIFFLVAALVSLTTMTRMVEEQRTQIGTMKALGYSKFSIALKYVLYALLASLIGSLIGLVIGQKVFPLIIINAYKMLYVNLPEVLTPINLEYSVTSTIAAVFSTTAATLFASYKELLSVPAELMRPAPPKNGKRVFLEKVGFVWKQLNFSTKSTIRNLVRYKKRFFMTILGIGACTGLLIVGFGLKDSISAIGTFQYGEIFDYDGSITIDDAATKEEREDLLQQLGNDSSVEDELIMHQMTIDMSANNKEYSGYIIVPKELDNFTNFITLQDRITKEQYSLEDTGVILSEKIASLLGVSKGETLFLKDEDGNRREVKILQITENYFFHYVYMTPTLYKETFQEEAEYNQMMLHLTDTSEKFEDEFSSKYMEEEIVLNVSFSSRVSESVHDMLKSLDTIVYVLVASAGLLAVIVLYNLNNINVSERIRELATLKVLGFFDKEVSAYVIRENIWLTAIGAFVGLFIGRILHAYVILTAEVEMTMFGRNIYLLSYVYSILLTIVFSLGVNCILHFKLKKIDMVESMKSVE